MATEVKHLTKLSSKNQVTIPVDVLRTAGLEPGDQVIVRALGPGEIEVKRRIDVIDELAGSLSGLWPAGHLRDLRREWDR
jgi:AbrB family looped-hinge helix DNA binding protein